MKMYATLALAVSVTICTRAEMRAWNSLPGKTVEAEYVKIQFDDVILRRADGSELRVPLTSFSGEDKEYIELANPPKLSVDLLRSADQEFIPTSPFLAREPLTLMLYKFGARVKQLDSKAYNYPLRVEIYAFTKQRYDPDKYHLIARGASKPFVLSKENGRRFEYELPQNYKVYKYELNVPFLDWTEPRGEKYGESLILVRDQRDEIVAYNSTKKWLYQNLDKLEDLPLGAWLNDDCVRTHPTVQKVTKKPGVDWLR
jgi:hypothetical protein